MRPHIFPILLAVIAIGGAAISGPSEERLIEPVQIDFANLHDQASSALQMLQASEERRIALQQTNEAAF